MAADSCKPIFTLDSATTLDDNCGAIKLVGAPLRGTQMASFHPQLVPSQTGFFGQKTLEQLPEMVTTQVASESESTCGTAVCVVSLNTNLSNLTNRVGQNLQVGGNSIRVSFNTNLSNLTNRAG